MDTLIQPREYHQPDIYAIEQARIFKRAWQCVGFTTDLLRHNDYVTREIGGTSVVVQNFNGALRAFTNVCSHRFNRIHVECRGNRPLQCAYHGWMYNEDGVPSGIPKKPRFDGLTPSKLCELALSPWRVATCGRLVFVNSAKEGPSLEEYLGSAFSTVEAMTSACGPLLDENVMTIRANWKILVENTLESYHVHFVHASTFSRLGTADGEFDWQTPHSTWRTELGEKVVSRLEKPMSIFSARPVKLDGYIHQLVFPNLTIASTMGTSFSIQFFEPLDSETTRFTSVVFQTALPEGISDSSKATIDALNDSVKTFNRAVFNEDKEICEHVQRGARTTNQPGVLSDEEMRVYDFQKHYVSWMQCDHGGE